MHRVVPVCALLVLACLPAWADEPPAPRLDGVDYANPGAYRSSTAAVGAGVRTEGLARQLAAKGQGAEGALSQMVRWIGRNLRVDASRAKAWRGVDQVLQDGVAGTEADRAMVLGAMARVVGVPVVWVKALPLEFVRRQRARSAPIEREVGRVFLEVHLAGRWHLLDPVTARLHGDYDPRVRFLPGDHVVFDKGADPHALVLPNRFELWQAQVRRHVGSVQLPRKPWTQARDLLAAWRVYVTGQGGPASYAREAAKTLGFLVEKTFNSDFDANLAQARGRTLIVTVQGGRVNLPERYWAAWLPPGHREILAGTRPAGRGWSAHRLADGTRVILVTATGYGPVELAVSEALDG